MASGAAQALLRVARGALPPPGAGPWYFLLALRLLALGFARGAWRGPPHDLLCAWAPPAPPPPPPPPGLRRLCAALCYNRHLPAPTAALWSLSFLLALLPIALLRLLRPPARARAGAEGGGDARTATRRNSMAAEHTDVAAGRSDVAAGRTNMAAGRSNMAAGRGNMAAGHTNMAAGHSNMAAGRRNMAAEYIDMAAGRGGEGRGEGSGDEDKMAAGRGHKMAAGRRVSGKTKMAAWPHPAEESGALMWMDESDAAARPHPSHESKMAAGRHPANESGTASQSGESKMAARRRPTPGTNMAASSLPALPTPGGHDGRGRWRAWLGVGAAAMLAVGEGGFLWAVLWRQLPAVRAIPIGCRLPAAPCPPLACALPARADKMAALLGVAASAAISLVAIMAAAVMAAARALRGQGREGEGHA